MKEDIKTTNFDEDIKAGTQDIPHFFNRDAPSDVQIDINDGTFDLGGPSNLLEEIEEMPKPSEAILEGLRQCTLFIRFPSTSPSADEVPPPHSSVGSRSSKRSRSPSDVVSLPESISIKSTFSDVVRGSGSTSEWIYQEPFEIYKNKVIQLCHDIGLGGPSQVEPMTGGSFNRVMCLSLPSKNNHDYVLRIPRFPESAENARDQAAVLHYVAPLMPVPTVLAFDPTPDNAIGHPYVLQEKLEGCNAATIYHDLPRNEKAEVITLIVDIITKLNTSNTDRPGQLVAGPTVPSFSHNSFSTPIDIEITGYRFENIEQDAATKNMPRFEKQPLVSHLVAAFTMRKKYDQDRDCDFMDSTWDELSKVAKQMNTAGLFSEADVDCVLWHWDLAFRNILVEKQATGNWHLTGVLDWDMLLSVPLVLTRATPTWLWCQEDSQSSECSTQSSDNGVQQSQDLTTDEQYLKDHFEQLIQQTDPNYMADAYGRGVWIRRLADFAFHGFNDPAYYDKQRELSSDWNMYYESLGFDPDVNDDDVDDYSSHSVASSQSSTGLYNQEEFDTYQSRVIQLCRELGLGEPSKLQRIKGGSYNRVTGITIPNQSGDLNFILRTPRFTIDDEFTYTIRDQVAAILSLRQYAFLRAPAIAAVDTTLSNAIESQYVIQHRVPGRPLQDVFFDLPLHEKLNITSTIAQFTLNMEKISLDNPGLLTGTQNLPWTSTSIDPSISPPTISGFRFDGNQIPALEKQPLSSLLITMLDAQNEQNGELQRPKWQKLVFIVKEMAKASLFRQSDSKNVLWHWDMCARHVFIDGIQSPPASDTASQAGSSDINNTVDDLNTDENLYREQFSPGGWTVTGSIDWDDVMSVPLVVSRVPKTWLWFNEMKRGWEWTGNRDSPPERELTTEELTIKAHFDQIMQKADPTYFDDTYGRGVWIRRMFRFAKDGFQTGADIKRYNNFVSDWRKYYSSLYLDTMASD